jgi:hypothetical protein
MVAVPARTNLGIPFRRWICKDTLIRDRCKCKRDICQGGVVGYPRGLWILRPGFESRPWPDYHLLLSDSFFGLDLLEFS